MSPVRIRKNVVDLSLNGEAFKSLRPLESVDIMFCSRFSRRVIGKTVVISGTYFPIIYLGAVVIAEPLLFLCDLEN